MENYLEASPDSAKEFYLNFKSEGEIVMLNLLRFKRTADYKNLEYIIPEKEISGQEAYKLYLDGISPLLLEAGSEIIYYGKSKGFLIGPEAEQWDAILLVKHKSIINFIEFAQSKDYLEYAYHRLAALADSRLLPSTEINYYH
ncbi:DUF1330 domain-containing protein [Flavobacterium sp. ST-75]|uniref:DUF1330 domain-containing protein n=1 Tax=Flavobacterium rhizophilum TaxID=3163296 RepID=A0ABW8YBJ7_9FLAO